MQIEILSSKRIVTIGFDSDSIYYIVFRPLHSHIEHSTSSRLLIWAIFLFLSIDNVILVKMNDWSVQWFLCMYLRLPPNHLNLIFISKSFHFYDRKKRDEKISHIHIKMASVVSTRCTLIWFMCLFFGDILHHHIHTNTLHYMMYIHVYALTYIVPSQYRFHFIQFIL